MGLVCRFSPCLGCRGRRLECPPGIHHRCCPRSSFITLTDLFTAAARTEIAEKVGHLLGGNYSVAHTLDLLELRIRRPSPQRETVIPYSINTSFGINLPSFAMHSHPRSGEDNGEYGFRISFRDVAHFTDTIWQLTSDTTSSSPFAFSVRGLPERCYFKLLYFHALSGQSLSTLQGVDELHTLLSGSKVPCTFPGRRQTKPSG